MLSAVVHSLATPGFTSTGGIKTTTDSVSPSGARGVKHTCGSQEKVRMARNNHRLTTVRAASVVSEARRQSPEALFTTDIEATVSSDN